MRIDILPPEVLQFLAYGGWLKPLDVLRLAQSSEALLEKLIGDEYATDKLRALCGSKTCVSNNWARALRFALRLEETSKLSS